VSIAENIIKSYKSIKEDEEELKHLKSGTP